MVVARAENKGAGHLILNHVVDLAFEEIWYVLVTRDVLHEMDTSNTGEFWYDDDELHASRQRSPSAPCGPLRVTPGNFLSGVQRFLE